MVQVLSLFQQQPAIPSAAAAVASCSKHVCREYFSPALVSCCSENLAEQFVLGFRFCVSLAFGHAGSYAGIREPVHEQDGVPSKNDVVAWQRFPRFWSTKHSGAGAFV